MLGIKRSTLISRMKRLGIFRPLQRLMSEMQRRIRIDDLRPHQARSAFHRRAVSSPLCSYIPNRMLISGNFEKPCPRG
jgi:hypothetical protein